MSVHILGIRHHSPACARLAATLIADRPPRYVLIEGPSDCNARLGEFTLGHQPPLALYSYAQTADGPAQCWYPFLDYSPEWVALRQGLAAGATVYFIDLPHWNYRALAETRRRHPLPDEAPPRNRYGAVVDALCRRFACDGDDALWDHLFETAPAAELPRRLDAYFAELRGDDPGEAEDQAREALMAQWIAAAAARNDGDVLVICGGWHKPALERLWPQAALPATADGWPEAPTPPDPEQAGSYLIPYEYRQVESLAGYGAGMQSPLFYQWCWNDGRAVAIERAVTRIVQRLRQAKVPLPTADLVALWRTLDGIARLRGHAPPTRTDLLGALQNTVVKEALEQPAPWTERGYLTSRDHPALREALLALTGDSAGRLDTATPQPPLLRDVERRLAEAGLAPKSIPQPLVLDRRQAADEARAIVLWRLKLIGVGGATLTAVKAPKAARGLPDELRFEEHWTLTQDTRWYPQLIEASVFGATLAHAAENALLHQLQHANPANHGEALVTALGHALRAGYPQLGERLAQELAGLAPAWHDHGSLAAAGQRLLDLVQSGFWGRDTGALLRAPLVLIGERLLWLLDSHQAGSNTPLDHETTAVRLLDGLIALAPADFDADFALSTLARIARRADAPPALRGAAAGVGYRRGAISEAELLAMTRALPPRDRLGDFLFGLFATARQLATGDPALVAAIHSAVEAMNREDFLVALPQLRNAFAWFPPRERGGIAAQVAALLGLDRNEQLKLLRLPDVPERMLAAKDIEARALSWAQELGLIS